MAGRMVNGTAALAELVRTAGETEQPGMDRILPVTPELSALLPGNGLRRGSTVAVAGGRASAASGGTSLLLALLAEASRSGSWCAVVGVPALGALAAAESGIALDRLVLVPNPGPDWPTVVAALIDGVDLVVTTAPGQVSANIAARLAARARQRGCVLMPFGPWDGADLTLQVTAGRWDGLGSGHGRLRRREVTVLARGRGAAARPKEATMWLPGFDLGALTIPPPPPDGDGPGPWRPVRPNLLTIPYEQWPESARRAPVPTRGRSSRPIAPGRPPDSACCPGKSWSGHRFRRAEPARAGRRPAHGCAAGAGGAGVGRTGKRGWVCWGKSGRC